MLSIALVVSTVLQIAHFSTLNDEKKSEIQHELVNSEIDLFSKIGIPQDELMDIEDELLEEDRFSVQYILSDIPFIFIVYAFLALILSLLLKGTSIYLRQNNL
jgi:hypothetical protein